MAAAKKSKKTKKNDLPYTVYVFQEGDYLIATRDIDAYGFTDGEVWGEYQLVRKVRPKSTFSLEEI